MLCSLSTAYRVMFSRSEGSNPVVLLTNSCQTHLCKLRQKGRRLRLKVSCIYWLDCYRKWIPSPIISQPNSDELTTSLSFHAQLGCPPSGFRCAPSDASATIYWYVHEVCSSRNGSHRPFLRQLLRMRLEGDLTSSDGGCRCYL